MVRGEATAAPHILSRMGQRAPCMSHEEAAQAVRQMAGTPGRQQDAKEDGDEGKQIVGRRGGKGEHERQAG
jgi:hypothetical protein